MYKIEKNIPIANPKPERKYPFNEMEIGDSFLIKATDSKMKSIRKIRNRISSACNIFTKNNPKIKFVTRRENDGIRCWRIK